MIFTLSKDYKIVFTNPRHFCFDECNFLQSYLSEKIPLDQLPAEIESMEHIIRKCHKQGIINAHFDFLIVESNPGKLKWENGKLFYKDKFECLFFHLIRFKKLPYLIKPEWANIPNRFFIHSFYFSKHIPNSIRNGVADMLIMPKYFLFKIKREINWKYNIFKSSVAPEKEIDNIHNYCGLYKLNNRVFAVGTSSSKKQLFLIQSLHVIPLHLISKQRFYAHAERYNITFDFSAGAKFLLEQVFESGIDSEVYSKILP